MIFYNLVLLAALPVALPLFVFWAALRPSVRDGLAERLGFPPGPWARRTKNQTRIWIHAASIGEYRAARPLIDLIADERPDWDLALSVMTPAGRSLAREQIGGRARIFFFPADLPGAASRALRRVAPDAILLVETELWPNFLRAAFLRRIPVMVINGRISPRSFRRYRLARPLLRTMLRWIRVFAMQSEADAERIIDLGAPPERVSVPGALKFDQPAAAPTEAERARLFGGLGWTGRNGILVAGSTHEGEEAILLAAFRRMREKITGVRLVLAPRHLERLPGIRSLLRDSGFSWRAYSDLETQPPGVFDILLLDVMGRLGSLYGLAAAAFVGGSLVPVGGHNLLEPAAHGIPVLYGPFTGQVRETADLLDASGGGLRVRDAEDLARQALALLGDEARREEIGRKALQAFSGRRGASRKIFEALERQLRLRAQDRLRRLDFRPLHERWFTQRFLDGRGGAGSAAAGFILHGLSAIYAGWQRLRAAAYARGWLPVHRLDRPVISVGNLTLGGTGKTPAVLAAGEILLKQGRHPVILSRGYGRRAGGRLEVLSQESEKSPGPDAAGDEPCLIASRLPMIPVVVGADRVAAGRHAAARLHPDLYILDDGFQHVRLHRDLNLLVIDARNPFGNGRVFPAGMLREPLRALCRADAVLLTHLDDPSGALALIRFIRRHRADLPVLTSRHRLTEMTELSTGRRSVLEQFRRRRVMAVTGIGQPESFFRMLQDGGMTVAAACVYSDHRRFSRADLKFWEAEARRLENPVIVTTEKDAVRLCAPGGPLENIWAVRMELVLDDPPAFEALLQGVFR